MHVKQFSMKSTSECFSKAYPSCLSHTSKSNNCSLLRVVGVFFFFALNTLLKWCTLILFFSDVNTSM